MGPLVAIPKLIRFLGLDPAPVLAAAGLAPGALDLPDLRVSYTSLVRVMGEAAARTGCPHFGLLLAGEPRLADLGTFGDLIRHSPTLGQGLEEFIVCHHLVSAGGIVFLLRRGGIADLGYAIHAPVSGATAPIYDAALSMMLDILRELCGANWVPSEVLLSHAAPADTAPFRQRFGAPVRFNSEFCALRFPANWLEHPIAGADPDLLKAAQCQVIASGKATVVQMVSRALRTLLLHGRNSGDEVAQALTIHRRTLNRRLRAEGATFQQVLDRVRYAAAREHLENSAIPISEIAASLGLRGLRLLHAGVPDAGRERRRARGGKSPHDRVIAEMRRLLPLLVAALAAVASGCAGLPPREGRTETTAIADTAGDPGGPPWPSRRRRPSGKTGVHPLAEPRLAFAARMLLASEAHRSIDAQYYIWHGDQAGLLLFEALWRAAERGVRVRLLLDDLNTGGLDPVLAALDATRTSRFACTTRSAQRRARATRLPRGVRAAEPAHAQQVVHRGRPGRHRRRAKRRQRILCGGRRPRLRRPRRGRRGGGRARCLGAVRSLLEQPVGLPVGRPPGHPGADGLAGLAARFEAVRADPESVAYGEAVRGAPLVRDLLAGKIDLEWTQARLVHDDPAKTLDTETRRDVLLFPELVRAMGRPEKSFDLVSPYFVPGDEGTEALAALAQRGTRVRVLTNSLASSEANVVHAGYAKRRQALLLAGVRLYEVKPTAGPDATSPNAPGRLQLALGACTRRPSPWTAAAYSSAPSTSTCARPC